MSFCKVEEEPVLKMKLPDGQSVTGLRQSVSFISKSHHQDKGRRGKNDFKEIFLNRGGGGVPKLAEIFVFGLKNRFFLAKETKSCIIESRGGGHRFRKKISLPV